MLSAILHNSCCFLVASIWSRVIVKSSRSIFSSVCNTQRSYSYSHATKLVRTNETGVLKVNETKGQFLKSLFARVLFDLHDKAGNNKTQSTRSNYLSIFSRLFAPPLDRDLQIIVKDSTMESVDREVCATDFAPPSIVRGMKTLDRDLFIRNINVCGLLVPIEHVTVIAKRFKNYLLKIPKIKPIAELGDLNERHATHRIFLFDPRQVLSFSSLSDADKEFFRSRGIDTTVKKSYEITLTYENWTYDEVLDAVLPEEAQGVGGFSTIGHIAHLNLKDNLLDYKQIIGEVILDKINAVKTVVNKIHTIDNQYRNFQMELLAGENNFITVAKEHGCMFEFDFSKVYWNSRLATEHRRITANLSEGDIVYDMFAGVGPFAIPAARKRCIVFANDLNPESYRWLQHNVKLNKVKVETNLYNLDGREFIQSVVKPDLLSRWKVADDVEIRCPKIHIVMNLPGSAIEFLDVFRGLFRTEELLASGIADEHLNLPIVHCYCFSKDGEDVRQRAEDVIGVKLENDNCTVRNVRNVAPNKEMMCITFTLPRDVLVEDEGGAVECKRAKLVDN